MTETASDTTGQMDGATPARPTTDDADTWKAYWQVQGMPWRTEPEIPAERQAYLAERRAIEPNIEQGVYPFKGVRPKLTRGDIEWLLATHESRGVVGPVNWIQEKDKPEEARRQGLDLRGADLAQLDLRDLPLSCILAGPSLVMYAFATREQMDAAVAQLKGANLFRAQMWSADFKASKLQGAISRLEQLRTASLSRVRLEGANLAGAQLSRANLARAQLQGADLSEALLTAVDLNRAQLQGVNFTGAELEGANLAGAKLVGVFLVGAHLRRANLTGAQFAGADLTEAQVTSATLNRAQLGGANLTSANLERADLRQASLDKATQLNDANLTAVSLDQTIFENTNLSVIRWQDMPVLGDELRACATKDDEGKRKRREQRVEEYQAAARAYRRLAVALLANGMNDEADTYRYRAQLMQRRFHWHSRRFGRWSFSALLALLAGYGYKPARAFLAYALVIAAFTALFMLAGLGVITFGLAATQYHELPWYEALVLSVASFHGRGFFQPVQSPGDPIAILAAIEAVFGLFIEVTFIATFTQRFFGK